MKKLIKILLVIISIIILCLITSFFFKICPPKGPWPTPPWCEEIKFERVKFDLQVKTSPLPQIKAVNMADTWGRNYNFGMFENTRDNIDSSFDIVKEMEAEEVYVHDFHRALYDGEEDFKSLNYKIVNEIFLNDMRDESFSEYDVEKLTKEAHERGLKIGIKHNMAFVNIGKYITEGLTGKIEGSVQKDYQDFNSSHSEEWIKDYFSKWQGRMVERAKLYQKYNVDIMSITPSWMSPTFAGNEELANTLWKDLISAVRKEFSGKIHVELSVYGFLSGFDEKENYNKYDYYKNADIVETRIYSLWGEYKTRNNPDFPEMKFGINKLLSDLDVRSKNEGIKLSVFFAPFSYQNAINDGIVEFLDVNNQKTIETVSKVDYNHQASAYQALFESLITKNNLERIVASSLVWDDAMDPLVKPKISISSSFRNKPAEDVITKWFLAK